MMKSYSASKFLQVIGVQQLVRLLQSKFRGEEAEAKVEVVLVEPGEETVELRRALPFTADLCRSVIALHL